MSAPRGLDPGTLPQREGENGRWAVPGARDPRFEPRDAPSRAVAMGLGLMAAVLLLSVAGVLAFAGAVKPRTPLRAETAVARFRTAGPPLLASPREERAALETAHRGPGDPALERAMNAVVQQGWNDTAPPPDRAAVAMSRAQAGQ